MEINWQKVFDWSIASVSEPMPFYHQYYPGRLVAYRVVVAYNYHDAHVAVFPVGEYGIVKCAQNAAYTDALRYRDKMRLRIKCGCVK